MILDDADLIYQRLVELMTEPVDPDGPNLSCFGGSDAQ